MRGLLITRGTLCFAQDKWRNLRRSVLQPGLKQTIHTVAAAASSSRTHLTAPLAAYGEESPYAEEFQQMAAVMQIVREIVTGGQGYDDGDGMDDGLGGDGGGFDGEGADGGGGGAGFE